MERRAGKLFIGIVVFLFAVFSSPVAAVDSPTEAYEKYLEVQRAGDLDGMAKYVSKEKVEELNAMSEEQRTQISKMMKMLAPVEYIVEKEDIQGTTATLSIKAKAKDIFTGKISDASGIITFIKEEGEWKIVKERLTGKSQL